MTIQQEFARDRPELRGVVTFLGQLDDDALDQEYADCDVLVAPSRFESFGLILVEAMMFEKPVVSTDIGGMREIVDDGVTGLLVPPDYGAALTSALQRLIGSGELRRTMGRAARAAYVERFHVDVMTRKAELVYQDIRRGWPHEREKAVTAGAAPGPAAS
jgi:glycogen(starch) synthase